MNELVLKKIAEKLEVDKIIIIGITGDRIFIEQNNMTFAECIGYLETAKLLRSLNQIEEGKKDET